jgi:hypothetical protein
MLLGIETAQAQVGWSYDVRCELAGLPRWWRQRVVINRFDGQLPRQLFRKFRSRVCRLVAFVRPKSLSAELAGYASSAPPLRRQETRWRSSEQRIKQNEGGGSDATPTKPGYVRPHQARSRQRQSPEPIGHRQGGGLVQTGGIQIEAGPAGCVGCVGCVGAVMDCGSVFTSITSVEKMSLMLPAR